VCGCIKSTEILHVFGPHFLGERPPPQFLDLHYKIEPDSNRVAKFDGDRPRDLGDYALEKKKHHEHFISPPVTTSGRPNNSLACFLPAR